MSEPEQAQQTHGSIDAVLDRLRSRFGSEAFRITEQWDADVCAIGIARPGEPCRLVYVSTCELPEGRYDVSLEETVGPEPDAACTPAGHFRGLTFDALAALVARHLRLETETEG